MSGQRVAVLTGARRGLGAATAEALARLGHHVVITARDEAAATATAARLAAAGLSAEGRALDVADDSSVAALFAWLSGAWGRIDVLVNNAGAFFEGTPARDPARAFDVPAATVAAAFEANTLGAYRTMQRAVPLMNAAGYGRVVNVSSGLGGLAAMGGGYPAYRASKAAMNALTRIFHAAAGDNVKVNSVCPGWVRTDMGGPHATRSIEEGIAGIVWAAPLPDAGPSGGFFRDGKPIPW